jgi:PTH1 family peptidyl-tRNA hydrolase
MEMILPKLIVGLGNPGEEYIGTRHNVGFAIVDRIVRRISAPAVERHRFDSMFYETRYAGRQLHLTKPLTFMNNSGKAVARMQRVLTLQANEILVVYDCLDLPLGRLRLRHAGGSGGHKGMMSIIDELGTTEVPRLRVGIGRRDDEEVVDFVLSEWTAGEQPAVEKMVDAAAEVVLVAAKRGIDKAMNQCNRWNLPDAGEDKENNARAEDKLGD